MYSWFVCFFASQFNRLPEFLILMYWILAPLAMEKRIIQQRFKRR